jgi:hypothetical protein
MAAELEEVVMAPDTGHVEELLPYARDDLFDLSSWRLVRLTRI